MQGTLKTFCASSIKAICLFGLSTSLYAADPNVLPMEAQIISGIAAISQTDNQMLIQQSSDKLITHWGQFDIGEQAGVTFQQPSANSVALNRILSHNPSQILGQLSANGRVFLLNPNGIVFGQHAQVNVGGLIASTLALSDEDFLANKLAFTPTLQGKTIENLGQLRAAGGVIAFIAPVVRNTGSIQTPAGTTLLSAADKVQVDFAGDGLITLHVQQAAVDALADNQGLIQADNGLVMMNAQSANALMDTVINQAGIIEANSLQSQGGRIVLDGNDTGVTQVTGQLLASGHTGGTVIVTGDKVGLFDNASIDVSGQAGGGNIFIGGGWQGKDPAIHQATATYIGPDVQLNASALDNGNGGTLVAWSDIKNPNSSTKVYGSLLARGGIHGGDGGRIETSGGWLDVTGVKGDAKAYQGTGGLWLFDPRNVTIQATGSVSASGGTFTPAADNSTVAASDINTLLDAGTSVTVTTGSTGTQVGDLTVSTAITKSGGAEVTLTLTAANSITINAAISHSGGSELNIALDADNDNGTRNGVGIILINKSISTGGGDLTFGTGATMTVNGIANTRVGGDVYVYDDTGSPAAVVFNTGGGALNVYGEMIVANTNGLSVTTNGGDATFHGILNSGNSYQDISFGTNNWTENKQWGTAKTNANFTPEGGTQASVGATYLATITSRLENAVASRIVNYEASWLGGRRVTGLTPNTDAVWRWVTGPEGLEDGGKGRPFFTQNSGSAGGSPYDDAYSNWSSNEPNNYNGSPNWPLSIEYESVLQFHQNQGQWNDLSTSNTDPTHYVKETNLAASSLTINAGAGTVTFGGAVGGLKSLNALTVTADTIAINGGAVTTEGLQTYTGNITLGGSTTLTQTNADTNFSTVASKNISYTGGTAASLLIQTTGNITLNSNSNISASSGALSVTLHANNDTTGDGGIIFSEDSSINGNGGNIILTGDTFSAHASSSIASTGTLLIQPSTSSRTIGIAGGAGGLALTAANFSTNFTNGFNLITVGKSTAGTITLGGDTTINDNLTLISADNIALNAALNASGQTVTLTPGNADAVTSNASGIITADALLLNGTNATYTLTADNVINTLAAANANSIDLNNTADLTIGTVGGINGVSATNNITIETEGGGSDITVSQDITSSAGDISLTSGGNIAINDRLSATNGDITLTANGTTVTSNDDGNLIADNLLLLGANASYTLYAQSNSFFTNSINTIAGSANSVAFGNSKSFTVNSIGVVDGITASGDIAIKTEGAPTADIVVSEAVTSSGGSVFINSDRDITLNANVTSATNIMLMGGRTVSGAGNLSASSLTLNGGGDYTLDTALNNTISTIEAENASSIRFKNIGTLTVGEVSVGGMTVANNIYLIASGSGANLVLSSPVTSTAGSIYLAAGQHFTNSAGASGISASSGRYFVYSTHPEYTTEGVTGYSKHYAQSFDSNDWIPDYATSGNWFLYSVEPVIKVSVNSQSINEGAKPLPFTARYTSGFIDGDTASTAEIMGTPLFGINGTSSTTGTYGPGKHQVAYLSGLSSDLGYTFADDTAAIDELIVNRDISSTTSGIQTGTNGTASTQNNNTPNVTSGTTTATTLSVAQTPLVTTTQSTMQIITPTNQTGMVFQQSGQTVTLMLGGNASSSTTQSGTVIQTDAIPVFRRTADGSTSTQDAIKIQDKGNALQLSPATATAKPIDPNATATVKSGQSTLQLANGQSIKFSITLQKNGVLKIDAPPALLNTQSQSEIILAGIAAAKQTLGISATDVKAIEIGESK